VTSAAQAAGHHTPPVPIRPPMWAPDGRNIYFTAAVGGAVHLFRATVPGGRIEQVTTGERRIGGLGIDRELRRVAYTVGEFDRPAEVWSADIDGRNERRLSSVHADFLSAITPATHPSERVVWTSYDGTRIEGFLFFRTAAIPTASRTR
jgi:dipeptidyl aminopeptidase/acylaminoacyl peptidase